MRGGDDFTAQKLAQTGPTTLRVAERRKLSVKGRRRSGRAQCEGVERFRCVDIDEDPVAVDLDLGDGFSMFSK